MASEAPPFWWEKPDWRAWALSPVSALYGMVAKSRMQRAKPPQINLPVLCVGNLTVGGGGKTPTSVAIVQAAKKLKLKPGVVSRGYGGVNSGTRLVDADHDLAAHVGDEPLLIAQHAPVAVSANRLAGAKLLESQGVDFIILDDGFQSMRLKTDYNLVVVDARRGIGNGHVIPGGPLRAPLAPQLGHADALLRLGAGDAADGLVRMAARAGKPVFVAKTVPSRKMDLKGKRVLAFAGIADPEKFYDSLTAAGAVISLARSWPDHHYYADDELNELHQTAVAGDLVLVTTEKDSMRLARGSESARKVMDTALVFKIEVVFDQPDAAQRIIEETLENFRRRSIART
ncbi:MAG: tetraacyldisaccharide 4'-kinase [Rhizobiaceae bacterium]